MAEKTEEKKSEKKSKKQSLTDVKALITKTYGKGSIMQGRSTIVPVEVIPTGNIAIDSALGCLGIPQGRIIEIYGAESSGKTTTCLHIIKSAQRHYFERKKRNGVAALIDAEHAYDPSWAEKIGVDTDNMLISQPDSGEEGLEIVKMLAESGAVDLIVVDSVAALTPQKVLDGEMDDTTIAALAQLMSKAMSKLRGVANRTKTTIIFINQIREKAGMSFGNPEVTPGGRALKFYASQRLEVRKGSAIKIGEKVVGFRPTMKVVKNKVAPPFTTAEYDIYTGTAELPLYGVDDIGPLLDEALAKKIIAKNGNFYSYNNITLGNGRTTTIKNIAADADKAGPFILYEDIKSKVYALYNDSMPKIEVSDDIDEDVEDLVDEVEEEASE
jgi:recombination protein RecA